MPDTFDKDLVHKNVQAVQSAINDPTEEITDAHVYTAGILAAALMRVEELEEDVEVWRETFRLSSVRYWSLCYETHSLVLAFGHVKPLPSGVALTDDVRKQHQALQDADEELQNKALLSTSEIRKKIQAQKQNADASGTIGDQDTGKDTSDD